MRVTWSMMGVRDRVDRTVGVTCTHDCPDACRAVVTVEDGRATGIRADSSHPVTGRHLCVKVDRYLERVYSPDRLTTPLRRVGSKGDRAFAPVSWDDALDEIVDAVAGHRRRVRRRAPSCPTRTSGRWACCRASARWRR